MRKIVLGFAIAAIIMAVAATFFGCSVKVEQPEQTTEVAVTEPIRISEVTTAIKEVISEFVTENQTEKETAKTAESVEIAATEEDFEALEKLMFDIGQDYDCTDENALHKAYCITIGGSFGMFNNVFSVDDREYISGVQDPGQVFEYSEYKPDGYEYERIPADKVDYILRNILNVEPDHSYVVKLVGYGPSGERSVPFVYYYDGYYYVDFSPAGSTVEEMRVTDWEIRPDGRYEVEIDCIELEGDVWYSLTVVAELKSVGGEKVWSIYKIMDM